MEAIETLPASGLRLKRKPRRNPEPVAVPFRLRLLDCRRWAVERFDEHEREWLAVYIDDSVVGAFNQLTLIVPRSSGRVVCARCERTLLFPRMDRESGVYCDGCPAPVPPAAGDSSPKLPRWFSISFAVVLAAWVLAAVYAYWAVR
jgi:hypothetical protein